MRLYARLALAGLPRGGGNGDDIRMGILHIMRDGGIKEGHRQVGLQNDADRLVAVLQAWPQERRLQTQWVLAVVCAAVLPVLLDLEWPFQ